MNFLEKLTFWLCFCVTFLGMQRAGKFPGILQTFGNFEGLAIFGNFGNFQFRLIFNILWDFLYKKQQNQICSALTIQCTGSALLFGQFASLYGFIERTTRLNNQVRLDLICYFLRKLTFYAFPVLLLGFQQKPQIEDPQNAFWVYS